MRRLTSLAPRTVEGPMAAIRRSRLDLMTSECEGILGRTDIRRSGSADGNFEAG